MLKVSERLESCAMREFALADEMLPITFGPLGKLFAYFPYQFSHRMDRLFVY